MTRFIASTLIVSSAITAALVGCGSEFSSSGGDGDGDGDGDSVMEGAGGMGGSGASTEGGLGGEGGQGSVKVCDPGAEDLPDDEFFDADCDGIDGVEEDAIFVSSKGAEDGAGTKDDPVAKISAGIALAQDEGKDVYVCNGEYDERLFMEAEGVNVFGGYDCTDGWARGEERAVVTPEAGPALHLKSVYEVTIDGLIFEAADAAGTGASSTAAIVEGSRGILLNRVSLQAGQGAPGNAGTPGPGLPGVPQQASPGRSANVGLDCMSCFGLGGESTLQLECPSGESLPPGGGGGNGEDPDGSPSWGAGDPGAGGAQGGAAAGQNGQTGAVGDRGTDGAYPSRSIGTMNGALYVPVAPGADGGFGQNGRPGGGGAGEARRAFQSGYLPGGGGGQGGYGGCGGHPGTAGTGGGASIALVLRNSEVRMTWSRLATGSGGAGGPGAAGGEGRAGGLGGYGNSLAGDGGAGGKGGDGGSGAPGAGGPAIGLALVNSTLNESVGLELEIGEAGPGGAPAFAEGPLGPTGIAVEAYDFEADEEVEL